MSKRGLGALVAVIVMTGCVQPPAPADLGGGDGEGSPAPVCSDTELGTQLPIDVSGSTAGGVAAAEPASCGDGEPTPAQGYLWLAPAAGSYRVAVAAQFPVTLDVVQGSCDGAETGCAAAELTNRVSLDVPMQAGAAIDIVIGGEGGATGTYELTIQREADRCGDGVCEASEDAASCAVDCDTSSSDPTTDPDPGDGGDGGGGGTTSICGDGVCDAGEDASCPSDCASSSPSSSCGDGTCDAGEDSDSCPSDCGDPSCDPDDDDCF